MSKIILQRRSLLRAAAIPAALLPTCPAFALLDWLTAKSPETRQKIRDAVTDKALVDAMVQPFDADRQDALVSVLLQAGYKLDDFTPGSLSVHRSGRALANMGEANAQMDGYVPDVEGDPVARIYIDVAKARGSVVKAYKPRLCGRLNGMFKQAVTPVPRSREWFDRDIALIEWSQQGRVVSLLVHAHQASTGIGVALMRYSTVFFGPANARHVENNVRNSEFSDFELRQL